MIRKWNGLSTIIRELPTIGSFKGALRTQMFPKPMSHLNKTYGKESVAHTRMRLGLNHLKQQLYSHHIIDSPNCDCGNGEETATHFLPTCHVVCGQQTYNASYTRGSGSMARYHHQHHQQHKQQPKTLKRFITVWKQCIDYWWKYLCL